MMPAPRGATQGAPDRPRCVEQRHGGSFLHAPRQAVDEVEAWTTGVSRKIWQKIVILCEPNAARTRGCLDPYPLISKTVLSTTSR
jgi:hypothetical protein